MPMPRPLTLRQEQVLRAYRRLHSRKVVAHELGISENTVKHHLTAIYERLEMTHFGSQDMWRIAYDQAVMLGYLERTA